MQHVVARDLPEEAEKVRNQKTLLKFVDERGRVELQLLVLA